MAMLHLPLSGRTTEGAGWIDDKDNATVIVRIFDRRQGEKKRRDLAGRAAGG